MTRHTTHGTTFHTEEHVGRGPQRRRLASATFPIKLSYSQHEETSREYLLPALRQVGITDRWPVPLPRGGTGRLLSAGSQGVTGPGGSGLR